MFSDILKRYEAIDTTRGTDKNTTHSYGAIYDSLFSNYKTADCKILEIGISGGHALLAYTDYFQNAVIHGLDIEDNCNFSAKTHPRIKLQFGNARSDSIINTYNNMVFDIIIEDASHEPEDQIRHFMDFARFVKPGGLYIIEDVNIFYLNFISSVLKPYAEYHNFDFHTIDLRSIKNQADDILLVFKKK